jgi:hypothetical protein
MSEDHREDRRFAEQSFSHPEKTNHCFPIIPELVSAQHQTANQKPTMEFVTLPALALLSLAFAACGPSVEMPKGISK